MTRSESIRLDLYNGLEELLGKDRATYLMTHLLPADLSDLLTRSDFALEMSQVKAEMSQVKKDLSDLGTRSPSSRTSWTPSSPK